MTTWLTGILAALVLTLDVLGGFVAPSIAEGLIATAIEDALGDEFGVPVDVQVDVAAPGPLLRGEIGTIIIDVPSYVASIGDVDVPLGPITLELEEVEVDRAAALDGTLDEVRLAAGSLEATVAVATIESLVRAAFAGEQPDIELGPVSIEGDRLMLVVIVPGGFEAVVRAGITLAPTDASATGALLVLDRVEASADEPAAADRAAEVVAATAIVLPDLPLGLRFNRIELAGDVALVHGEVPNVLTLSASSASLSPSAQGRRPMATQFARRSLS